jgi:hypothetical protein
MATGKALRIALRSGLSSVLAALALQAGPAQAQIYKCVGPVGVGEYSNAPSPANRRCTELQLSPIMSIPAPKLPHAAQPAGAVQPSGAPAAPAARATSPSEFPRVDGATQKARDTDRRGILQEELRKEEEKLAGLRDEYKDGEPERLGSERNYQKYLDRVQRLKDDIGRSEANIGSLKRELGALRN